MSLSIRVKFILLVGVPIVLIGAMMPIVSTVQHHELLDAADDQVEEAERAFWAEMQDDLADLHLAARIIASSEETRRALRDGMPAEALKVARVFSDLYPRLDVTLALRDGRVIGDVGPTDTPASLHDIADLSSLEATEERHQFLPHGCADAKSSAPPAQAVLVPVGILGWVLVCEPLDMGYLENVSDKLKMELAFVDKQGHLLSVTKHFPTHVAEAARAGTTIVEQQNQSWAAQRFTSRGDILTAAMPLEVIATVDISKFSQSVHGLLHWMLATLLLLGGLAAVIGARIAGKMVSSLAKIIDAFKRVEQNEYVHVLPVETHDELELLTSGFNHMVDGLIERDRLRTTFGKYMTESVVAHLLSGKVALGGETIQVTILFSDIRSFTTISETMDAQTLVGLLNEYFTEMVSIIMKHGGVVDKYIGDAIMAVFGAPVPTRDDAANAVRAAVDMRAALARLNKRLVARGVQPLRTGIGIHTGEVVAGNIGSEERMEYTVIGDPVNVASRLESCTKDVGVDILISETTYEQTKEFVTARPVEQLSVKGRAEPVKAYEVIVSQSSLSVPPSESASARSTRRR